MSLLRRRRGRQGRVADEPAAMPCRELVECITEYLEGTLPETDRARFDEHLQSCPQCTAYLDQMRTVLRVSGRLTEEEIPEPAREDLLRVFREWKSA
ncbi:MAG: anti-sigma factor family protein [Actinomycetota bacterium]